MNRLLPILLGLLFATAAQARDFCTYPDIVPPAIYDHEPTVPYKIYDVPMWFLQEVACPGKLAMRAGCAFSTGDGFYHIYIRDDVTAEERACVLRHEKAHLNGWKHRNRGR